MRRVTGIVCSTRTAKNFLTIASIVRWWKYFNSKTSTDDWLAIMPDVRCCEPVVFRLVL